MFVGSFVCSIFLWQFSPDIFKDLTKSDKNIIIFLYNCYYYKYFYFYEDFAQKTALHGSR